MENVAVALYAVESEAYQAFTEVSAQMVLDTTVLSQIVHVKKKDGKIEAVSSIDSGVATTDDTMIGGLLGTFIGILGGPIGMLLGGSTGLLVGSTIDLQDSVDQCSLLEYVADKLQDGDNALIILAQEEDKTILNQALAKFTPTIMRWEAGDVAAQIADAQAEEAELQRIARQNMRKEKTEEFKQKAEELRGKLKGEFADLKAKIKK